MAGAKPTRGTKRTTKRTTQRTTKRTPKRTAAGARAVAPRRWSKRVTETSDAMDLELGVFTKKSARAMAMSVKRSAERSTRRKAPPFRSAMSMLTFYENRGGKNLSAADKRRLEAAKQELRKLYHRA
jgi:hypothetical protein